MQRANIMVGLGGGRDTTVPKYNVTAAEIAILRALNGDDSVHDVERVDDDPDITSPAEYQRLRGIYGAHKDGEGNRTFDRVFPGTVGARLPDKLADLNLPDEFFKATSRASATAKPKPALKGTKAGAGPAAPDEDGIGDLG